MGLDHKKILIVDDNIDFLRLLQKKLTQMGCEVISASSPSAALDLFRSDAAQFDLVITDYDMPEMNGLQLAEAIFHIRRDVPVILCSGSSPELRKDAPMTNIHGYVLKPVELSEIINIVAGVLKPSKKRKSVRKDRHS